MNLWQWLYDSTLGTGVRDSTWIFPFLEVIHIYSLIIVIGLVGAFDLRLMGRALQHMKLSVVASFVLRWILFPVGINVVTGTLLFMSKAPEYSVNRAFQVKIALIVAGVIFHIIILRRSSKASDNVNVGWAVKLLAGLSLAVWAGVIAVSRWIAYA